MTGRARRAAGELEAAVLAVLWSSADPLTPSQVQLGLTDAPAYNTVHTILTRLCEKGSVRRVGGHRAAYAPAQDAQEWAAAQMRAVLDRGEDRAAILQRFVTTLSAQDEAYLRTFLNQTELG